MIYGATGHRMPELGGYGIDPLKKIRRFASSVLVELRGVKKVITGMAQGWDMAVAHACHELDIPFVAAVPFEEQHRMWPRNVRKAYEYLLKKANEVVVVSPGEYAPWKMHARNKWIVDHSEYILALWNGKSHGGTFSCLQYAKRKNLDILNLWPRWEQFER